MKPYKSKIGEYGVRYVPVEGYRREGRKKDSTALEKETFKWKRDT